MRPDDEEYVGSLDEKLDDDARIDAAMRDVECHRETTAELYESLRKGHPVANEGVRGAKAYDWRADVRKSHGHGWGDDCTDEYIVQHDRLAAYIERLEAKTEWLARDHASNYFKMLNRVATETDIGTFAEARLAAAEEATS